MVHLVISISSVSGGNNTTTGTSFEVYSGESGTIGETFSVGVASNYAATLSCTGNSTALSGSTLTINPSDIALTCTETNTLAPATLTLRKALGSGGRANDADQFTVAIRTGGVGGTVVNSTTNSTTTGTGATVTANTGTTGTTTLFPGATYTLTEAMAASSVTPLSGYTGSVTCTDSAGLQTGLPSGATYSVATGVSITPVAGALISCTFTNTAAPIGISGRVFEDNGTSSGTANDGLISSGEPGVNGAPLRVSSKSSVCFELF